MKYWFCKWLNQAGLSSQFFIHVFSRYNQLVRMDAISSTNNSIVSNLIFWPCHAVKRIPLLRFTCEQRWSQSSHRRCVYLKWTRWRRFSVNLYVVVGLINVSTFMWTGCGNMAIVGTAMVGEKVEYSEHSVGFVWTGTIQWKSHTVNIEIECRMVWVKYVRISDK